MAISCRFQDRLSVLCIVLVLGVSFSDAFRPVSSSRTTTVQLFLSQHAAVASSPPLAEYGDWQAFFDDDRYCLVYYFNSRTGTSQWEPPPNFPIPAVPWEDEIKTSSSESTRSKQSLEKQFAKGNAVTRKEEKEKPSAFAWLVKGALQVASDLLADPKDVKQEQKESKPWWSFLVDDDEEPANARKQEITHNAPAQRQEPTFWDRLFGSAKTHTAVEQQKQLPPSDNRSSMRVMQQQHTEWLKFLDGDSPTIPLVPPSEREAKLQQKLYADSLARQENLRRNYKAVQEHRSRTFSLSALKRNSQQAKDWHQYMKD